MNGITECHFAGHGKRPARVVPTVSGTYYLMMNEDESKYGKGVNDSKYTSFVFRNKGMGMYEIGEYVFFGIRLYGLHTLLMVNKVWGGRKACCDYSCYDAHGDMVNVKDMIVGDLVEMETISKDKLSRLSKDAIESVLENFDKLLKEASGSFVWFANPEEVEADKANHEKIKQLLQSMIA